MKLERLHELGFDGSYHVNDDPKWTKLKCSQCEALYINGVPTHEIGCPHIKVECKECNTLIPKGHRLCESCANPQEIECHDSSDGKHHFSIDWEYDETGGTETCEHCGEQKT